MADLTATLTKKVGPLPIWAWAGIAGVGVYFLVGKSGMLSNLTGQSASTAATTGTTGTAGAAAAAPAQSAGSQLSDSLGLLQQLQGFDQQSIASYQEQAQSLNPSTQQTANSYTVTNPGGASAFTTASPGTSSAVPNNSPLQPSNTIPPGTVLTGNGSAYSVPWGNTQVQVIPVFYNGAPLLVSANHVTPSQQAAAATGVGGPAPRNEVGAADPIYRPGHPMLKRGNPTFPHYGVGGPSHVTQVAARMGVHPARVLALNPHMRAGVRPPGSVVRVA